jgi:hypothetical protein
MTYKDSLEESLKVVGKAITDLEARLLNTIVLPESLATYNHSLGRLHALKETRQLIQETIDAGNN